MQKSMQDFIDKQKTTLSDGFLSIWHTVGKELYNKQIYVII